MEQRLNEALIEILAKHFTSNSQILECKEEIMEVIQKIVFDNDWK